jgi:hypothetical protein
MGDTYANILSIIQLEHVIFWHHLLPYSYHTRHFRICCVISPSFWRWWYHPTDTWTTNGLPNKAGLHRWSGTSSTPFHSNCATILASRLIWLSNGNSLLDESSLLGSPILLSTGFDFRQDDYKRLHWATNEAFRSDDSTEWRFFLWRVRTMR